MKKICFRIVLILALLKGLDLFAQSDSLLLYSRYRSEGISIVEFRDSYVSQLPYSGIGVYFEEETARPWSPQNSDFSIWDRGSMSMGLLLNPSFNASAYSIQSQFAWGVNRHFKDELDFPFYGGLFWDLDFGMKYLPRNVNNPLNVDAATNLNLRVGGRTRFNLLRKEVQLSFDAESPVMGCMFLPEYNQTYYELSESENWGNNFVFSSLHNKTGVKTRFILEIPLRNAILTFGVRSQQLSYHGNGLKFNYGEWTLMTGMSFDFAYFAGTKNQAPKHSTQVRY